MPSTHISGNQHLEGRQNKLIIESGGDLLSRAVTRQVSWAQKGLTSVFGMGTGGSPSPLPPEIVYHCQTEGLHPHWPSFMPYPLYALRITRVHTFLRAFPRRLSASAYSADFRLPLTSPALSFRLLRRLSASAYLRRLRSGYLAYILRLAPAFSLRIAHTHLLEITLAALAAFAILVLYASCTLKTPYASTRQSLFLSMVSP